jgi:hypothetical protein
MPEVSGLEGRSVIRRQERVIFLLALLPNSSQRLAAMKRPPTSWFFLVVIPIVWIALAITILSPLSAAEPPATPEIHQAARAAMDKFVAALNEPEVKKTHGFAADDDFSQLSFGPPVEQKLLPKDRLEDKTKTTAAELLQPTGVWMVPVLSHGKLACLVTVRRDAAGKWSEEKLGMVELARALDAVGRAWPADKGFKPVLVVVPSVQGFYFQIPQQPPENLTPLDIRAAAAASPETWKPLKPAAESIARLRG